MVRRSRSRNSLTPAVRRFLLDVFKPTPALLGKRALGEIDEPGIRSQRSAVTPKLTEQPACIALQNEDQDEDAVVITALNVVPFCCHADLLTMSRTELVAVADMLNAKLPRILQIDVGPARSAAYIRNSIELLVGLRRDVPQAPKPVRSQSIYAEGRVPDSPASLLATGSRSNISVGAPALAALQEEAENLKEEEDMPVASRPQKKRRYNHVDPPAPGVKSRPITRSQSHRVASRQNRSPIETGARVLRTLSQKLPERKPMLQGVHPNITTTRGRSGSRCGGYYRSKSAVLTSTPKKRRVFADAINGQATMENSPASLLLARDTATPLPVNKGPAVKRKLSHTSADSTEVTFGIEGMTVPAATSGSDMDISSE